jgi:hypothetical protein
MIDTVTPIHNKLPFKDRFIYQVNKSFPSASSTTSRYIYFTGRRYGGNDSIKGGDDSIIGVFVQLVALDPIFPNNIA